MDSFIDQLPAGIDRALLRILSFHQGRDNAIGRIGLETQLTRHGFVVSDREARAAINLLRKQGHLICSAGGTSGGYYLPASMDEYVEYRDRELHPRAMDLLEQEKAMNEAAEKQWGKYSPNLQMRF